MGSGGIAVKKFMRDLFTEDDGISWCIGRTIGFAAACVLIYKFIVAIPVDHQGFAIGIAAIIASVAAKNYSERKENR